MVRKVHEKGVDDGVLDGGVMSWMFETMVAGKLLLNTLLIIKIIVGEL